MRWLPSAWDPQAEAGTEAVDDREDVPARGSFAIDFQRYRAMLKLGRPVV
jgi:hypothetical protein